MSDPEFEHEPIPGLPQALPPGERILWQGAPTWRALAREAFHARAASLWFGVFIAARGVVALVEGQGMRSALGSALGLVPLAAVAVGLLVLLAWLNARAALFTITTRRVVMRFGVALPMSVNLPFRQLQAADLAERAGGEGDIALRLGGPGRLAWFHLWPFARPWRVNPAEPMLRGVPEARRVSALLAEAVRAFVEAEGGGAVPRGQATPVPPPAVQRARTAQLGATP